MIVSNLKKQIGGINILNDISFVLSNNDKIGLVGQNGSGKSTLLKVLAGEIKKDAGDIKSNGEAICYLKQEIPYEFNNLSILEYIKREVGIYELETKLQKLENNLTEDNMSEYGDILNDYLLLDGYSFDNNLKNILLGLNLKIDMHSRIGILSGGEKIKVLLAIMLLKNSDILLLDEPTNNLDIEAINWLESKLKLTHKKMIIVSHDEIFLSNVVNKIYELANGKIKEYNLSYKEYLKQKELEYVQSKEEYLKAHEQQDKLKKQLEKAVSWSSKGNSSKAHSDNDKIANNFAKERTNSKNVSKLTKALQKVEVPIFEEKKPINVFFNVDTSKGNKDICLERLVCGYETFKTPELNVLIPFGSRVNIIGENGSGKTTLIKTILGQLELVSGNIKIGSDAKIGYISQDTLNSETKESIYDYLTKGKSDIDKSKIFVLLDKFNISYSDKDKPYASLSPGERTRINLVKLVLDNINVLVLDEVTNHLDKEALDLIYELVSSYTGTIISISHNRKYNEKLNADIELNIKTGNLKQKDFIKHKWL